MHKTSFLTRARCVGFALGVLGALLALPASAAGDAAQAKAEAATDTGVPYGKGAVIPLNEDGSSSLRLLAWNQIWARAMETNPGTTIRGGEEDWHAGVGIRRARVLLLGKLGDKITYVTHFGINNQTWANTRKPQVYIHDAWAEYKVAGPYLAVGAGLHYWHGISRMTNASTLNFLAVDSPIVHWATIERSDQFARNLGLYAKGKLGGFDYRLAVNKPFTVDRPLGEHADYNDTGNLVATAGYFKYDFLDIEANTVPFAVGTYLGKKRVFNVGAGFQWHPDGMATVNSAGKKSLHDALMVGLDTFLDLPFEGAGALTAYASYLYYDMGPGHLRNVGIMNPGQGGSTLNGGGNAYPVIGTGHHVYAQAGYLLPEKALGGLQLQPYAAGTVSLFDRYDDASVVLDGGINWYMVGHHSKVTVHYRNRPVFTDDAGKAKSTGRANEAIVQFAIFL